MKAFALILLASLVASAAFVSPASAGDGCEGRPGYRHCEYQASAGPAGCEVQYRYYYHDAFYAYQAGCWVGPKYVGFSTFP